MPDTPQIPPLEGMTPLGLQEEPSPLSDAAQPQESSAPAWDEDELDRHRTTAQQPGRADVESECRCNARKNEPHTMGAQGCAYGPGTYDRNTVASPDRCRRCGQPEDHHAETDGACPDDDGPHPHSDAYARQNDPRYAAAPDEVVTEAIESMTERDRTAADPERAAAHHALDHPEESAEEEIERRGIAPEAWGPHDSYAEAVAAAERDRAAADLAAKTEARVTAAYFRGLTDAYDRARVMVSRDPSAAFNKAELMDTLAADASAARTSAADADRRAGEEPPAT